MRISLIAAIGNNRVIGIDDALPWKLPVDMKRFRQLTMGKPVIMGRRTLEAIGKVLPGRTNIVLTHNESFQTQGCTVVHSIQEALTAAKGSEEVMIIGGALVFRQFLPRASRMYLTLIHADFDGNVSFPEFDPNDWQTLEEVEYPGDKDNPYPYSFLVLERKPKA